MIRLSYDLHIHSCLSPCGDRDNTPANIVGMAVVKELDVIALCDHNTAKNCPAALEVANTYGITLICGMEITTAEEVHVICLLPDLDSALELDRYVNPRILPIINDPTIFGEQLIINSQDQVIGIEEKLLINATSITFDEVFPLVEGLGGVAVPAHIDKSTNGLISNLGFIPPGAAFRTIEMKNPDGYRTLCKTHEYLKSCKVITNSDAHYLYDIKEPVDFLHVEENTAKDVIKALKNPAALYF